MINTLLMTALVLLGIVTSEPMCYVAAGIFALTAAVADLSNKI